MSNAKKKKIILFLGAGASAPFGYPTTEKFLDGLKAELGNSAEGILLSDILKVPHVRDIEHVLEMLKALRVFKEHPIKELVSTFRTSIDLPMMSENLSEQLKTAESLEDRIQSDIYRQYEFLPNTIDAVTEAYEPLLEMISSFRGDNEIPIFTTNYDRVIEEYCIRNRLICIDGFKITPPSDEFEWNDEEFKRKSENVCIVKLFKLHGSLNWRRRHDFVAVKIGSEERTRGTRRFRENLLVYPTEKLTNEVEKTVLPEKEPFGLLHVMFRKIFRESEVAIFIGFNFRDEYLNEIVVSESEKKKIIIVSPHATEIKKKIEQPDAEIVQIFADREIVAINGLFGELSVTNGIESAILK